MIALEIYIFVRYYRRFQINGFHQRRIRHHCSISVCLRLFTAGWYVVTKGKLLSLAFFFRVKADGLAAKLTPERDLSKTVLG